jgi:hypothetical protein
MGQEYIEIKVMDKDMSYDDLIGKANYYLGEVYKTNKKEEEIVLAYKGKNAGTLKLNFEFVK